MTRLEVTPPVSTLWEAAGLLRRPFEAEVLGWKPDKILRDGGAAIGVIAVPFIDRGLVVDRLNLVIPDRWSEAYFDEEKCTVARLTIDGQTREDVGDGRPGKERRTDSLKRVALKFGIGVSLLRMPRERLLVADGDCEIRAQGAVDRVFITEQGTAVLRERYGAWLSSIGVEAFGDVLKHGHAGHAEAVGDGDEHPEETAAPETTPAAAAVHDPDFLTERANALSLAQAGQMLRALGVDLPEVLTRARLKAVIRRLSEEQRAGFAAAGGWL